MRKILLASAALAFATAAANAATINVALGVSSSTGSANTATASLSNVAQGSTIKVYVFANCNTLQDPASNSSQNISGEGFEDVSNNDTGGAGETSAGGIRGFEFNVNDSALTSIGYSATAYASSIKSNFTTNPPQKTVDAGGVTSFEAAGTFYDGGGDFSDTVIGTPESASIQTTGAFAGYDLIATETWVVQSSGATGSNTFIPTITGPTYYDSTDGALGFVGAFDTTNISDATVNVLVPEPASLSLLGLGALSLVARRRRA